MQFSQQEIEIENVCADASDIRLESSASLCEVCKKGSVVPVGRETQMVERHDVLGDVQGGFRKGRGGADNIFILHTVLWKARALK